MGVKDTDPGDIASASGVSGKQRISGGGGVVAPAPRLHGSNAPKIRGSGGVAFRIIGEKTSAPARNIWLDAKLGDITDQALEDTGKISLRSVYNFRSGVKQHRKTREGLRDALIALGIPCTLDEIPA